MVSQIKEVFWLLPDIFMYFVPGVIFLSIHHFMCSNKGEKQSEKYFIFKSVTISFIIIISLNYFGEILKRLINIDISKGTYGFIVIVSSAVISYIYSRIYRSQWFNDWLNKIGINKSLYHNILDEIVDLEYGMWVRVYLPSEKIIYIGQFRKYEEKEEKFIICLSNYKSITYNDREIEDCTSNPKNWVMVNIKDISRVEIFYNDKSKKG